MAKTPAAVAQQLRAASRALDGLGARWALVGGIAVSSRCDPRFTRDVDLAVAVEGDEVAERMIRALARSSGWTC